MASSDAGMSKIRIEFEGGSGGATPALDELARKIDTSMQYASQKMTASFTTAFDKLGQQTQQWASKFESYLKQIETSIDRVSGKMARLNGGGAGGSGGKGIPGGFGLYDFQPTGAFRQNSSGTRNQYYDPAAGVKAWTNNAGEISSITGGPSAIIAQRQAEQEANRQRKMAVANAQGQYNMAYADQQMAQHNSDYYLGRYHDALTNRSQMAGVMAMGDSNRQAFRQQDLYDQLRGDAIARTQMAGVMATGEYNRRQIVRQNQQALYNDLQAQHRVGQGTSRFMGMVDQFGLKQTGSTIRWDKNGNEIETQNYAGSSRSLWQRLTGQQTSRTGTLNTATGQFSFKTAVDETDSLWKNLGRAKDMMVGLASSIFTFQSIAGAINKFLVQPFKEFVGLIFSATDEYRKFENSISGVAGGAGRARAIDTELLRASRGSPMTIAQLHEAGVGLTFTQYGASRIAGGSAGNAAGAMVEYATMLQQLSNLAPEQGVGGAQIAVREALAGNFQSARRRLNTSPELIAGSLQKPGGGTYSLSEITGNQTLTMQAFQKFADTWIGQEPIEGQKNLFSNARAKLGDSLNQAAAGIGNAGVYDNIVDRFRSMAEEIYKFIDSDKFKSFATKVSGAMTTVFDSITDAVLGFSQRITGTDNIQAMLGKFGDVIGGFANVVASVISQLPQITSWLGEFFNSVGRWIFSVTSQARQAAENPLWYATKSAASGTVSGLQSAGHWLNSLRIGDPGTQTQQATQSTVGGGSSFSMPAFNFQGINSISSPYAANRRGRDYIDSIKNIGNYRPNLMGILNNVGDSAKLFQAMGGTGADFSFPENPFTRAMNTARGVPMALAENIAGSGTGGGGSLSYPAMLENARAVHSSFTASNIGINNLASIMKGGGFTGRGGGFINSMMLNQFGAGYAGNFATAEKNAGTMVDAVTGLPGAAGTQFGMVAGSLAQQVSSLAPQIQSNVLHRIMTNLDGVLNQFADALKLGPAERQKLQEKFQESIAQHPDFFNKAAQGAAAAQIEAAGTYGSYSVLTGEYTKPNTPRVMREQQRDSYYAFASKNAADAATEYDAHGNTDLYQTLTDQAAKDNWNAEKLKHDLNDALVAIEAFSSRSRDAIENGIGDALYGLITGTSDVSDAFKQMANSIIKSFSDMTANMLMNGLFGDFLKPGAGAGGVGVGSLGGIIGNLFGINAKADGGVFPGSFMPFKAFSDGGIANSPMMGLVAEAGRPEAIVPLPNGRSIPVEMRGGGGGRTFVVNSASEARAMGYDPSSDDLVNLIADNIHRGGKIHKAIRAKMR